MTQPLSVAAAFAGRSVLITGATGYVGSLVLEQLLRVCPAVDRRAICRMCNHVGLRPAAGHTQLQHCRPAAEQPSAICAVLPCVAMRHCRSVAVLHVQHRSQQSRFILQFRSNRVFVLVREKRDRSPADRLRQLLDSGLFHLLWDRPGVLERVSESPSPLPLLSFFSSA